MRGERADSQALHTVEVLLSVAESAQPDAGGGGAQDWALARLALEGSGAGALPLDPTEAAVALLAGTEAPEPRLAHQVEGRVSAAPDTAALGFELGVLDPASPELIEALQRACRTGAASRRAAAGLALCWTGQVGRADLAAVAEGVAGTLAEEQVLPSLVLASAPDAMLSTAADAVVEALLRRGAQERIWRIGRPLGLPPRLGWARRAPEEAVKAASPSLDAPPGRPSGSRRRRAQKWVASLLEGLPGPAAALLRALYADRHPPDGDAVAAAAILRAQHLSGAEVSPRAVLQGWAGLRPTALHEARQRVAADDLTTVQAALQRDPIPPGALSLLAALREAPAALPLLQAGLDAVASLPQPSPADVAVARVLAWHCPDAVVRLLQAPHTRPLGLRLARFAPFTPVLSVLLELPLPAEPSDQAAYALALASMGDATTLPLLQALAQDASTDLDPALHLAEDLLGTSLR